MIFLPGRKEIREEVYKRLRNHPKLLDGVSAISLTSVILANIGWYWDIEDVGRAHVHVGTRYEDNNAYAGLEEFIEICISEFKIIKGE